MKQRPSAGKTVAYPSFMESWLGVPGSYRKFFNLAQLNCDLEEYLSAAMQDFLSMYGKMCFSCMIFLMV